MLFLRLGFANIFISYESSFYFSFKQNFTENVLDIRSYPDGTIGPTMAGSEEKFSKLRFSSDWKALF